MVEDGITNDSTERVVGVLILILVEDSRRQKEKATQVHDNPVLILILVEDSRRHIKTNCKAFPRFVLILILVEDSRRPIIDKLNPGSIIEVLILILVEDSRRLILVEDSRRLRKVSWILRSGIVLILILVEDSRRPYVGRLDGSRSPSLNPYSSGR